MVSDHLLYRVALNFLVFGALVAGPVQATQYPVVIDTTHLAGLSGALVFDFTSTDQLANTVSILNFTHDGTTGLPETQGGLVEGDIILLLNPAPLTRISDDFFFNQLLVPFADFGSTISFTLQLTENGPPAGNVPLDELSLFFLDTRDLALFQTGDPLGAQALFALCVDGTVTGMLDVFSPAVLVNGTIQITAPNVSIFADGFETGNTSAWSQVFP